MRTSTRRLANARAMRHAATRSEGRLWNWLRDRRFSGYKFRRQHAIGRYIADFYCPELRLVIEMDGEHHRHRDMHVYDDERTDALAAEGVEVLRIPNVLLIRDAQQVME